jgi:hypothetical protein
MTIRNDLRPTTPKPSSAPSTPTPATGPADLSGMSGVDDDLDAAGVTDIEKLAGQSLEDGMSLGAPAAAATSSSTRRAMPIRDPEATADARDPASIAKLINAAAEGLAPGESVILGGKLEVAVGVAAEVSASVSVTKRADGRLDVKLVEAAAVGAGAALGVGAGPATAGGKAKEMLGVGREATYTVGTGEEAALLAAKFAAKVAATGTPLGQVAQLAFDETTAPPTERKIALTGEVELEGTLLAGFKQKGEGGVGLVESPPGSWFVEMEVEEGADARLGFDVGAAQPLGGAAIAGKVKGSVKATVRIPVATPSMDDLAAPSSFVRRALDKAGAATVELEVKSSVGRPGAAGEVKAKKEVPLVRLHEAFISDGWKVTGDVLIGPREESAKIVAGDVEVTATRSFHVLTKESGTLKDLEKAKQAVDDANLARSGALRSGGR